MISLLLFLPLLAAATPATRRDTANAPSPSVTIQNGTVVGSSSQGVDTFKGIPFAQPPVGNLRLRPPQPLTQGFGTIQATATPKSCPQFIASVDTSDLPQDVIGQLLDSPLFQAAEDASEDCLTVNVQRPAGTNSSSNLPVLFWVYGGGFQDGSTSSYDGSTLVQRSFELGQPIVYVSVNYRLGGFGFLGGKELAEEHSTNLGLRDQRLGLEWAAENVRAFGGDPSRVTIWGQSAGSISVFDHTVFYDGDNTYHGSPLFRGVVMNSGSIIPATDVSSAKPQEIYDTVVRNAGCSGPAVTDSLACLRSKDYTTFLNAANSVPGIFSYRSVDLPYLPRPDALDSFFSRSPEISVRAGQVARTPLIIGDVEDEGTIFSLLQSNISTNAQLHDYLVSYLPASPTAAQDVSSLISFYPDQPLEGQPAGSPFGTGFFNNFYPQYKRLAAILGDLVFTLARRDYLSALFSSSSSSAPPSSLPPTWSYLASLAQGTPILGSDHGSDLSFTYAMNGPDQPATLALQTTLIAFVTHLDPNALGSPAPLIPWPQWTPQNRQLLHFTLADQYEIIPDDFRSDASEFIASAWSRFAV